MPTIFTLYGYRFMFYSNDHEPIHIHAVKGECRAKFDLFPTVSLVSSSGIKAHELKTIDAGSAGQKRAHHRAVAYLLQQR